MTTIDRSIFRKYDIRGIAAGDAPQLTPAVAFARRQGAGKLIFRGIFSRSASSSARTIV